MSTTPTEIGPFIDPAFGMITQPARERKPSTAVARPVSRPEPTEASILHGQITALMFAETSKRFAERRQEPTIAGGSPIDAIKAVACGALSLLIGAAVTFLTWAGLQGQAIAPFHQPRPKLAWSTARDLDLFQMSVVDRPVYGLYGTYFAPSTLLVGVAMLSVLLALMGLMYKARLGRVSVLSLLGLGLFLFSMGLGVVFEYKATHG